MPNITDRITAKGKQFLNKTLDIMKLGSDELIKKASGVLAVYVTVEMARLFILHSTSYLYYNPQDQQWHNTKDDPLTTQDRIVQGLAVGTLYQTGTLKHVFNAGEKLGSYMLYSCMKATGWRLADTRRQVVNNESGYDSDEDVPVAATVDQSALVTNSNGTRERSLTPTNRG